MPADIAEPPVKPTTPTPSTPTPPPEPKPTTPEAAPVSSDPWDGLDEQLSGKKTDIKSDPKAKESDPKQPDDKKASASTKTATAAPSVPKQLREELERTQALVKTKEEAIASYEKRIAEYESKGKDTTALAERLTQREKELEEAKAEVRAARAEMSPEFKDKWEKPFQRRAETAREVISKLAVGKEAVDEATGETAWKPERRAVWETDFPEIYEMFHKDPVGAEEKATAKFGKGGRIVMSHVEALYQLDQDRKAASQEEKVRWKEKDAADRAQAIQKEIEEKKRHEEGRKAYETSLATKIARLKEQHPEWYDEDPSDPEGNELLKKGREMFNYEPKNEEEAVATFARNQLNAITALRERNRNRLLKEENAQLKSEIEELRKGRPGPGSRSTSDTPSKSEKDPLDELDEMLAGKM